MTTTDGGGHNHHYRRLEQLLASRPDHAKARLRAGRACIMLGSLNSALGHFEAVITAERRRKAPTNAEPRWAPPAESSCHQRLGVSVIQNAELMAEPKDLGAEASEARATVTRLISHCSRSRSLAAAGRTDEASCCCCSLYVARHVVSVRADTWLGAAAMPASESLGMGYAVPVLLAPCFFCCRYYTSGCTSRDLPQSRAISRQALYLARAVRRSCTHSTLGVTLILDALELGGRCDKSPRLIAEINATTYRA